MTFNDTLLKKVDLHVHTPVSVCYSEAMVKPEEIVDAALAAGLDAIGIADHNSAAAIDGIRMAAGDKIKVFPEVEVTTKNGHFLAIFDIETDVKEIEVFLDDIGIDRKGWGDAHTTAAGETVETLRKIHEYGGLAIASHIDRWPSGFLESKTSRRNKRKIHESEYLDALEITIPETRDAWRNGEMRDFPMKRACIQGSDAHKPEEVGRRPVYIQLETVNLAGLKTALEKYDSAVYFPDDIL
ncbi:MAG: PHP domain-containing protein [Dehalococcoidales bacterium]|nr:PHP domain-containing protein [Dehalococcoidales bacterium]